MAAYFIDSEPASGAPGEVHASQLNDLGAIRRASDGNSYIYLKGVTACVDGDVMVFQQGVWAAVRIATGKRGDIAIATAVVDASTKFGWFTYVGQDVSIANSAIVSNVPLYIGGVAGGVDDTAVKGDQIFGMTSRNAAAGSQDSVILQINRAFVGFTNESTG